MARVALTPALVRRHVEAGQIYASGSRRWVRILRVHVDPPHVTARRCSRRGELYTTRYKTGPLAGCKPEAFTIYLTWRDGGWRMPTAYVQEE